MTNLDQASINIPWETAASVVTPMIAAAVVIVRWMMARIDASAADLRRAIDSLTESVDASTARSREDESARAAMVQAQNRMTYTQERILAILESELRLVDREREEHEKERLREKTETRR